MDIREALLYRKILGGGGVSQEQIDEIAVAIGLVTPSNVENILNELDEIIANSNQTTGAEDDSVIEAVDRLIDGYRVIESLDVVANGTYTAPNGKAYNPINVNVPTGGGGGVPALSKGVNFIDYDGTVVATWETSTVASKTALPDNPSHDGLTAQGWNWSLGDIQSYIADYPDALVTVGQMYITDDGKTRIYIHLEEGRLSPYLGICPNGSVDIDWGDGSTHDTVTGTSISTVKNTQHTYASGGDYIISLTVTGSMGIAGSSSYGSQLLWNNSTTTTSQNSVYQSAIQKVEIGNGVTNIDSYAFTSCYSLTSVTIPNSVTSISAYVFQDCYSLTSVTIPNSVTSISIQTFTSCYSLTSVAIPNSITSISAYIFTSCYSLTSVTIPNSVTDISNNAFNACRSLASVTIPNSVTDIENYAFRYCYGLGFLKFTRQTPPTVYNSNAWLSVPSDCIIYVPAGTLSAYTSATNYPNPSTYTYVEY